jgi:hypothetical protein
MPGVGGCFAFFGDDCSSAKVDGMTISAVVVEDGI